MDAESPGSRKRSRAAGTLKETFATLAGSIFMAFGLGRTQYRPTRSARQVGMF